MYATQEKGLECSLLPIILMRDEARIRFFSALNHLFPSFYWPLHSMEFSFLRNKLSHLI